MNLLYPFIFSILLSLFSLIPHTVEHKLTLNLLKFLLLLNCILWFVVYYIGDQFMLIKECLLVSPN